MIAEELKLVIRAEVDAAISDLRKLHTEVAKNNKVVEFLQKTWKDLTRLLIGGGVIAGVRKLAAAFADCLNEFYEADREATKLNAVLLATGGAVGLAAEEFDAMADALSRASGIDDEVIISAQALLLTFDKIGGEIFPKVVESAANLSVVMGTDMRSAALQLGKALQNPAEALEGLGRIGIRFTDAQKKSIEQLVVQGRLYEAQKFILGELEKRMGGVAKAMGETAAGQADRLKNAIANLKEEQGKMIVEETKGFRAWLLSITEAALATTKQINAATKALADLQAGNALVNVDLAIQGLLKERKTLEEMMASPTYIYSEATYKADMDRIAAINRALIELTRRQEHAGSKFATPEGIKSVEEEKEAAKAIAEARQAAVVASNNYAAAMAEASRSIVDVVNAEEDGLLSSTLLTEMQLAHNAAIAAAIPNLRDYAAAIEEVAWAEDDMALSQRTITEMILATREAEKEKAKATEEALEKQKEAYAAMAGFMAPIFESMGQGAEAMKDAIKNAIASVLEMLAKKAFVEALEQFALFNYSGAALLMAASIAASAAAGAVRAMAEGGIVTGPTHALIGEKGPEAVIPLDKAGRFGTTIHYHIAGNMMREEDFYKHSLAYSQGALRGY